MGLDIYVGPLTRYYSGNWLTILQQSTREHGKPVEITRPEKIIVVGPGDIIDSPAGPVYAPHKLPDDYRDELVDIIQEVSHWQEQVSDQISELLTEPLSWNESMDAPYFTDKPGWDGYTQLILWSAYAFKPKRKRPKKVVSDLHKNRVYKWAIGNELFYEQFSNQIWLPGEYDFTFETTAINDENVWVGWSKAFLNELTDLNERTWKADAETIRKWAFDGPPENMDFEHYARFGFSVFHKLLTESVNHGLPMIVDW